MNSRFAIPLLLCAAVFATFGVALGHDWLLWDDQFNVYRNPLLNPPTGESLARFWREPYFYLYMPVTYSFWWLLAHIAQLPQPVHSDGAGMYMLDPRVFHAAGIALHAANTVLVFGLLRRFAAPGAAALGALLFGIHPAQVEAVVWVTGMNNLTSAFFALLALGQYVKFAESNAKARYAAAFALFILALLAKPTAVAVPLLAWALDRFALRREARRATLSLLPWMGAAVLCALLTRGAQDAGSTPVSTALWARPLLVSDSLGFYAVKTLLPYPLAIDYGRTPDFVLSHWSQTLFFAAVPILLTIAAWRARVARPLLWTAWAWFCLALIPTSGVVPFYFHAISLVADRYLYLALFGPALALSVWLSHRPLAHKKLCAGALALLCVWSAFTTFNWTNSFSLFEHTLSVNPRSWTAHTNYGTLLAQRGDVPGALTHFRAAQEANPQFWAAYYSEGRARLQQGDREGARRLWTFVLQKNPAYQPAQIALQQLNNEK